MHICIDGRACGPGATGIGAFARSAIDALSAAGGAHRFLAILDGRAAAGLALPPAFAVASPDAASPLWGEVELPVLLEERGVDVFFSPLFACPVVRGARQVVTLHDVFPASHPELSTPEFAAFWKARLGASLRSACHAVAVSGWSKRMAAERLRIPEERLSVVRQSVGDEFRHVTRPEAEKVLARYGLAAGEYVLYVGAVDPRKNLHTLIRAFARLPELALVIAGGAAVEGYDLAPVAAEAGVAGRVRFAGYVPGHDLPGLYSHARCFAFPSLAEGFGRPCIEAMSCGVPVVASNRTALPDTCGKAALQPDPESVDELAEALKTACFDEKERKRLIAAGGERAAEFSKGGFASDLIRAFEAAMAGPAEGLWAA